MENAGGHFNYDATLTDANRRLGPCRAEGTFGPAPQPAHSRIALAALKARMAARGLPLYVYIAPFARCGARIAAIKQAYRGLADNEPTPLPDPLFAYGGGKGMNSVHVNAEGAAAASALLGRFIRSKGIGEAQ